MAQVGQLVKPGDPAPAPGVYQCIESGCSKSFTTSVGGTPLPPSHHAGAPWKLVQLGAAPRAANQGRGASAKTIAAPPPSPPAGNR